MALIAEESQNIKFSIKNWWERGLKTDKIIERSGREWIFLYDKSVWPKFAALKHNQQIQGGRWYKTPQQRFLDIKNSFKERYINASLYFRDVPLYHITPNPEFSVLKPHIPGFFKQPPGIIESQYLQHMKGVYLELGGGGLVAFYGAGGQYASHNIMRGLDPKVNVFKFSGKELKKRGYKFKIDPSASFYEVSWAKNIFKKVGPPIYTEREIPTALGKLIQTSLSGFVEKEMNLNLIDIKKSLEKSFDDFADTIEKKNTVSSSIKKVSLKSNRILNKLLRFIR